jgi:hypothetical protein
LNQIKAKIVAHSKSSVNGKEIITMELEYPRFIHAEILTHRMFSRNAASSRAIPVTKMVEQVRTDPAMPVHWGKNQAGMQAKEELNSVMAAGCAYLWKEAAEQVADKAYLMDSAGLHKQVVNRILEPFQWMKTVVTATEWGNFYWLRNHEDAQPEIKRLAEVMLEATNKSKPIIMNAGWWHTPYSEYGYWNPHMEKSDPKKTLADALAISSSCCAQVSYRLLDDSIEKARMVYKRLVESSPVHASPFEHQATPMAFPVDTGGCGWEEGATHMTLNGEMWSGNFNSWIQYRQLIPNNVKRG